MVYKRSFDEFQSEVENLTDISPENVSFQF